MTTVTDRILSLADTHGILRGTRALADRIPTTSVSWVVECLARLEEAGEIRIIRNRGGRGHRTIIIRRRRHE